MHYFQLYQIVFIAFFTGILIITITTLIIDGNKTMRRIGWILLIATMLLSWALSDINKETDTIKSSVDKTIEFYI